MTRNSLRLTHYALLIAIILLAFFLRVWRLPDTPPGLWYDEAYYAMDAAWLLDGGPWQLFFSGNNGREPIYIYLQALAVWLFGATPLVARLVAPLAGVLTVPLVYVLARRLTCRSGWDGTAISLVATVGIATSFWHIGLSRGGYRGVLLPLAAALLFYLFWRGWQQKSWLLVGLAGITLGMSQYTYLAARALPLVFAAFALLATPLLWKQANRRWPSLRFLWLALIAMAVISALVFAPLGWLFYQTPVLFSARTGDVLFTPDTPTELVAHLTAALRLFIDNGDPNWRHHLPGRPMLGWLGWLGFWPGLFICLRRRRQPAALFLMTGLLMLFLPALLSTPPVHALRLSALLPLYFVMFAVGLVGVARWASRRFFGQPSRLARPALIALAAVLAAELLLTGIDYFGRWATAEETYVEYNTPLVDFIGHVAHLTEETPVILPFQIYVHPTARYLLRDDFTEQPAPPTLTGPALLASLPDNFRMLNVANIPELPAYVWLERDETGQGRVYVSRPPRQSEQDFLRRVTQTPASQQFTDRFGRELAVFRSLTDPTPLLPMFTDPAPQRTIDLTWPGQAQLLGYDVIPPQTPPGQPLTVNFYWRSLTDQTFDQRLFLQLVNRAGEPINQYEGEAFREDMYRWRPDGILPTQHTLWVGPETPPGPYLVRLGFFDPDSGQRLPLLLESGQPADQTHLGLFYVAPPGVDPHQPETPLDAVFGDSIRLAGVTLPPELNNSQLPVTFHWQTIQPTPQPMTVFLQLLDESGQVVAGWDSQPFDGLYPTSRWSPGERISDTFTLPLPADGLPPGQYRLITGLYDFDTGRRLLLNDGSNFAEVGNFTVNGID